MPSTPQQTATGAASFEKISDKLAAVIFFLNVNSLTAKQLQANAAGYDKIPAKEAAIIYLLNTTALTPGQLATAAECFQCVPDYLASWIFLLNTTNQTANQIEASSVSFQKMSDKWGIVVYLLNINNLTLDQIAAGAACLDCMSGKWSVVLYLLSNYSPTPPPPFNLGNITGLLFQMFPDPATIVQSGGNVTSWASNLGSMAGFKLLDGNAITGNQTIFQPNWRLTKCAIENSNTPGMLYAQNAGFTYQDMTFIAVVRLDIGDSLGSFPRILSMVNNAGSTDDFSGVGTAVIAYGDNTVGDNSLSNDYNGVVANVAGPPPGTGQSDLTVPCIIAFRSQTGAPFKSNQAFWQALSGGPTFSDNNTQATTQPFNSDTFSAFLSFLNPTDNSAMGQISLIAAWNRGISDAEMTKAFAYLTTLYSS